MLARLDSRACRGALALLLLTAVASQAAEPQAAEPKAASVALVVDYGDGVQLRFSALQWRNSMTVLDALTAAGRHPRGIKFSQRGRGATALVTAIDNLENQGSGKNWLFSVNGKLSNVGCGARLLEAGDTVLWEFKQYE